MPLGDYNITGLGTVAGADYALLLELVYEPGCPWLSDAETALQERSRDLVVSVGELDGLVHERITRFVGYRSVMGGVAVSLGRTQLNWG